MIIEKAVNRLAKKIATQINTPLPQQNETALLAIGKILCAQQRSLSSDNLNDYEFKIFSQWGEDGIIQYLINHIKIDNSVFIEFGVENYQESSTRFLMMNNNWRGLVIDGNEENIADIKRQDWFWKYDLKAVCAFIDCDNINTLLEGYNNVGILSIDIDGNDYHIMKAIDFNKINPSILICEYNSVFGKDRSITIPYDKSFYRTNKHYSNLYYGASLPAIANLAKQKGYALVGCCSNGANAFFVRRDLLTEAICEKMIEDVFVESRFRECRNTEGSLSYLSGKDRLSIIEGLDVINTETNLIEKI